ncbi:HlyD family type I secretion periplasmic adaptor subunit [Vibrio fluminensis]|uniref:HlyD family type I secretion periplasmic adaptor subunit n=1 Tax=Vibrio fluminensis TaxID=2783614 RepID=UPI0018883FA0|nr:HlyD family type I secretion periplasmic adaptor subunit [Vibrio fluminensis]
MANSSYHEIHQDYIEYRDGRNLNFSVSANIKYALALVLILLFGFGYWASFAELSSAAIARGMVIVESKRKPVQHLEGGIVKQIHVEDGQNVEQGELLVTLDSSQAQARFLGLQAQWQSDLARLNRLQAELQDDSEIKFDARLLERDQQPRIQTILETQTKLFEKRRALQIGENKILLEKVAQAKSDLKGLQLRFKADKKTLLYLGQQVEMHEKLLETGNTSRSKLLDLKRESSELEGDLAELTAKINRAIRSVSEAELQDENAEYLYAKQLGEEIQQLEKAINETAEAMNNAEQVLSRVEIRAPQAGIVVGLTIYSSESVISPGEKIMEIVPQQDLLIIEAMLKPEDIDNVYESLSTEVRLTAYNFRRTPPIRGQLIHISADTIVDQTTGEPAYLAKVQLEQADLKQLDNVTLYPGMPAEVMILLNEQTPLDYLLGPLSVSAYRAMREI